MLFGMDQFIGKQKCFDISILPAVIQLCKSKTAIIQDHLAFLSRQFYVKREKKL